MIGFVFAIEFILGLKGFWFHCALDDTISFKKKFENKSSEYSLLYILRAEKKAKN